LDSAYAKLEQAAREGDRAALVASKNEFYGVVLEGCGNPYVKQMLTIIHNRVNLLRATSMMHSGRLEASLQEIRRIVRAVRAKDAVEAEAACVAHIDAAAKVALKVLEATERKPASDESARERA
jgi:DNA-binding GntR family transcriptional regulator